jgi:hypothetical protein
MIVGGPERSGGDQLNAHVLTSVWPSQLLPSHFDIRRQEKALLIIAPQRKNTPGA